MEEVSISGSIWQSSFQVHEADGSVAYRRKLGTGGC